MFILTADVSTNAQPHLAQRSNNGVVHCLSLSAETPLHGEAFVYAPVITRNNACSVLDQRVELRPASRNTGTVAGLGWIHAGKRLYPRTHHHKTSRFSELPYGISFLLRVAFCPAGAALFNAVTYGITESD